MIEDPENPDPRQTPRLWNFKGLRWEPTELADDPEVRRYHSAVVLQPDATVLAASGLFGSLQLPPQAAIYAPPYLFENDQGGPAIRPVITGVPAAAVEYCDAFTVGVDTAAVINVVCIIRASAVTHGFNMDQRRVELPFSVVNSTSLQVRMTQNPTLAPPGDYLLFVLKKGVPSVAKWIRLERNYPDTDPPDEVSDLNADMVSGGSVWLSWTAPEDAGDCGAAAYDLRLSTSQITDQNFGSATPVAGGTAKAAGEYETTQVSGLPCGQLYYFALKTCDEVPNCSAISNVTSAYLSCGGGGLLRAGDGEAEQARMALNSTAGSSDSEPASQSHGGEAADLEASEENRTGLVLERRGEAGWLVRQARSNDIAPDGSQTGAGGAELQVPAPGGGWKVARHDLAESPEPIGLRLPFDADARFVLVGDYALERIESRVRAGPEGCLRLSEASHSRTGDVSALLPDSTAQLSLEAGDSLSITYSADTGSVQGTADHYFVVSAPRGAANQTRASPERSGLPARFALHQNHPNPFATTTRLRFDLPRGERVRLEILDLQGRRVARLVDGTLPAGRHAPAWDRRKGDGGQAAPGVYLYRITAGSFRDRKKLVVLP